MAKPLRIEYAGAVYHVTNRGNDKKSVFKDDQDRETFLTFGNSGLYCRLSKFLGVEMRMNLRKRRAAVINEVEQYAYRQQEIASHPGLHCSSVSRIVKGER